MIKFPRVRKPIRNDILLIVGILLFVLLASVLSFLLQKAGDSVTVTVNGAFFGEYLLNEDQTVEITVGDRHNRLVIENGEARISNASCPDGICVAHRPIRHDGESIICLPNKVVVEIHAHTQNQPDIVS